ncbi:MAG: transcription antitermination factor NusB [Amphiplicatus sp.]
MPQTDNPRRSAARLAAVQALYQMETGGGGAESVIREFIAHRLGRDIEGAAVHEADAEFFADIVRGVIDVQRRIDPVIERHLARNWTLSRLDATARAILRAAAYELSRRADIPFRVVIDEYVEIANAFFDGDEPRFINGVLDAAAREARPAEAGQ